MSKTGSSSAVGRPRRSVMCVCICMETLSLSLCLQSYMKNKTDCFNVLKNIFGNMKVILRDRHTGW